jgi:hypothetical protein
VGPKIKGSAPRGMASRALPFTAGDSLSKRLAGGHPLQGWAVGGSEGRLRMEDRGVGVSHRHARRSDRGGAESSVYRNALRGTGEFRRMAFRRAGFTAKQPSQAPEKSRMALLGSVRPILRRRTNGTGNVRCGLHDRQRIGGGRAGGRHQQHKHIHGCFFLETKPTAQGGMTERGPSHPTRGTRGGEAPLLAHRPLAAELGAIHRPMFRPRIRAIAPTNDGYEMPMVTSGG